MGRIRELCPDFRKLRGDPGYLEYPDHFLSANRVRISGTDLSGHHAERGGQSALEKRAAIHRLHAAFSVLGRGGRHRDDLFRNEGLVNDVLRELFGLQQTIPFLTEPDYFRAFLVLEVIWKEAGWGTIIFLAALAGVNPALYEAAVMDGAGRFRQIWHITLPAIRSTIIIMLIIRLGDVLEIGFEQVFLQLNAFNMHIGNTLDTFVYYKGIQQSDYSFSTAVGVFKGLVGLVLVMAANRLSKRFGEQGVY